MIAKNSQVLTEASKALYQLNADEIMRQRCRAREDFILHENAMKRQNQELNARVDTLTAGYEAVTTENAVLNTKVNTLTTENVTLNNKIDTLTTENVTLNNKFASAQKAWNAEREQLLAKLTEYESKIANK